MTEVYGPGAFLLAGTEMYRMAEDAPKQNATIPQNRIQEIAAMLPDRPQGIGRSYKDRTFWNKRVTTLNNFWKRKLLLC